MLRIHIGSIPHKGLVLEQQVDAGSLPLLNVLSRDAAVRFSQPLHVSIYATLAGETILIEGSIQSEAGMVCSRCLVRFGTQVKTNFSTTAVPGLPPTSFNDSAEEFELTAADVDLIDHDGISVDFDQEVAQQIIMALPFNPLCSEACKGLCSQCGANLNRTTCRCADRNSNSPFAVLKTLSISGEQE